VTEKVLFEMHSLSEGDQIVYEIRHPQEGIEVKIREVRRCNSPLCSSFHGRRRYGKLRRKREDSRRQLRRTLDFYERLFDELYDDSDANDNGFED